MKTLKLLSLSIAIVSLLSACGGGGGGGGGAFLSGGGGGGTTSSLLATGGTGSTGGEGGSVYIGSTGSVKVLKSGSVDASFTVSAPTPSFGANHVIVNGGTTTVQLDADAIVGGLYVKTGDPHLYLGNGNGILTATDDAVVTGLTINAGATLVLVDQNYIISGYGTVVMTNDLVINGTLTSDTGKGLSIDANLVDVESGGKITTSATTAGASARAMLFSNVHATGKIINHGTIEAKGVGSGNGALVRLRADDLIINYGTIDTSGGSSATGLGGIAGDIYIFVDHGNFYSSGTVRANGGDGGNGKGGDGGGSVWVDTAFMDNTNSMNGDIIISGTWEAIGGNGMQGDGGAGGDISFETDAMGTVNVNASFSTRGGSGTAGNGMNGDGGTGGKVDFYSLFDPYNYGTFANVATPGKIRVSGTFELRGGAGEANGGMGGGLYAYGWGANSAFTGVDVELVGFPSFGLNGGDGSVGGRGWISSIYTYAPQYPNINSAPTNTNTTVPAGSITNEAKFSAKGGAGSLTGGAGGVVEMAADAVVNWGTFENVSVADANTVINNSGSIDVSGGTGDVGGAASGNGSYSIYFSAKHVTDSGNITAKGGVGATTGGNGGNIYIMSLDHATTPTTNTGALSVKGGSGGTTNGTDGTKTIDGSVI
jgi:hypothetical protein